MYAICMINDVICYHVKTKLKMQTPKWKIYHSKTILNHSKIFKKFQKFSKIIKKKTNWLISDLIPQKYEKSKFSNFVPGVVKNQKWTRKIICPNRINLPSPRSQWQKIEWEKRTIIATGGVVRADLFYWDCLRFHCRSCIGFSKIVAGLSTLKNEKIWILLRIQWKKEFFDTFLFLLRVDSPAASLEIVFWNLENPIPPENEKSIHKSIFDPKNFFENFYVSDFLGIKSEISLNGKQNDFSKKHEFF